MKDNLAGRLQNMTPLQRAAYALKETQSRLENLQKKLSEPIAIVGIACRFPGGAVNPDAFWQLLRGGVNAISEVPADRWDIEATYDPDPSVPGKMNSRWGGFLNDIDRFDNHFFAISDREAIRMDPQQRLLLELCWESLENGGIRASSLRGSSTGVFVGLSVSEYGIQLSKDPNQTDAFVGTGTSPCIAANRISFAFDFRGPSMTIDTACSSSLVALHMACQSIRRGETTAAIVGGASLLLSPIGTINLTKAGFSSAEGKVRAFDRDASGYVRGEGAAVVVLKRLSAAAADGDTVHAVIRSTAVNQNGVSNGLTAPSRRAQVDLLRQAYAEAGVSPGRVDYVEAQGTGTLLGDAIEVAALAEVMAENRPSGRYCAIGSVKTNLGHLEAASGMASLIKVVLALRYHSLPPSLHCDTPNPDIRFSETSLRVQRTLERWPERERPRVAGVSAFGFGGSNAHAVLEEAPISLEEAPIATPAGDVKNDDDPNLLVLSARSDGALGDLACLYCDFLLQDQSLWGEICATAALCRDHHRWRLALVADSREEAAEKLKVYRAGEIQDTVWVSPGKTTEQVRISVPSTKNQENEDHHGRVQSLADAAERYVNGADVDWSEIISKSSRRVNLPLYPWQRQSLWALPREALVTKSAPALPTPSEGKKEETRADSNVQNLKILMNSAADSLEVQPRPPLNTPMIEPRTPLEQAIAHSWCEVLRLEEVSVFDNFFELGGDSLQATILLNRLQDDLSEVIHVLAVFQAQTVADLATHLRQSYPEAIRRRFPDEPAAPMNAEMTRYPKIIGDSEIELVRRLADALAPQTSAAIHERKNPRAVLVLSPPRSGSTLLRVMLAGHPGLFAPPELELLGFATMKERAAAYSGAAGLWLGGAVRALMEACDLSVDQARQDIAQFEENAVSTQHVFKLMQMAIGDRLLVDKTPSSAGQLKVLQRAEEVFEEPLYIHLLRHPCAMIRSFVDYRMHLTYGARYKIDFELPFAPRQIAELAWVISHQNILAHLALIPPQRRHVVMFEDLVRQPETTMTEVCGFLGLDYRDEMVHPYNNLKSKMVDGVVDEGMMQGDQKFLVKHTAIDPGVAFAWQSEPHETILGPPARSLAATLGYTDLPAEETVGPLPGSPTRRLSDAQAAAELLEDLDDLSDDEVVRLLAEHLPENFAGHPAQRPADEANDD